MLSAHTASQKRVCCGLHTNIHSFVTGSGIRCTTDRHVEVVNGVDFRVQWSYLLHARGSADFAFPSPQNRRGFPSLDRHLIRMGTSADLL